MARHADNIQNIKKSYKAMQLYNIIDMQSINNTLPCGECGRKMNGLHQVPVVSWIVAVLHYGVPGHMSWLDNLPIAVLQ